MPVTQVPPGKVKVHHVRANGSRTQRDDYPDEFKMTIQDIVNAPEVPTIPPLRTRA